MLFTELAVSFHTKTGKHKLHITASSLMSETQSADRRTIYTFADTQVFKIH